ncbi:MAG: putative dehydrogenase [Candidatus Marivariicella framensis]|jgi:predicted dehydrogenase|tara:strand:- start:5873 stop:7198 length:1326 start_codon:yes stop_codon:yes gene_type:complete
MNKRTFLKTSATLASTVFVPSFGWALSKSKRLKTAHIGVGGMGGEDLKAISSHNSVDVFALCDVDSKALAKARELHPNAKIYSDYRIMLSEVGDQIEAVIVSTPDHTHAPASLMAMNIGKPVYCQKPLTHHISEARKMQMVAKEKNLVTQMGIQVHSFYDYKLATKLIQSGIIGKVNTVRAWSPKNWGYDGPKPEGTDPIPSTLDWNLWTGTAKKRNYKKEIYHPGNWRKLVDFGCGTLGDMGVHIFDTPYNALALDVPKTIKNECRLPNGFGFPEKNKVTYIFPGTEYTTKELKWVWYDGADAPDKHLNLKLPNNEVLHDQGSMFIGEKGRLYLPHFMKEPQLIVDGKYQEINFEKFDLEDPVRNYELESKKHYHQFVDACLGKDKCSAPFSYASKLTETILLGVIAGRFPGENLNWDKDSAMFKEAKANQYISGSYREF